MYHPLFVQTVALLGLRIRYWIVIIVVVLILLALLAWSRNRTAV